MEFSLPFSGRSGSSGKLRNLARLSADIQLADSDRTDHEIVVEAGNVELLGHLTIPPINEDSVRKVVVIVHGTGSRRNSPQNRYVASVFNDAGLATLSIDLLTPDEDHDRTKVFDIDKLTLRLVEVTKCLVSQPDLGHCHVGYFGLSIGAAAALCAASNPQLIIDAVVTGGGRPDLAAPHLNQVQCPTLFIVGAKDGLVVDLTRHYQANLGCVSDIQIVPNASHLFEEEGCLEQAALLAQRWFNEHLQAQTSATP
jgi:putative phosphoribosyl transferase